MTAVFQAASACNNNSISPKAPLTTTYQNWCKARTTLWLHPPMSSAKITERKLVSFMQWTPSVHQLCAALAWSSNTVSATATEPSTRCQNSEIRKVITNNSAGFNRPIISYSWDLVRMIAFLQMFHHLCEIWILSSSTSRLICRILSA